MKKLGMRCLSLGLLCGIFSANAASVNTQPNDLWVYIDGQYYQCTTNTNGTTTSYEAPSCKNAIESYKTSLNTCKDYYTHSSLRTFSQDCIRPITKDFKKNSKKECFFEAKTTCMSLCLENYKYSSLIRYSDCDSYCSEPE
ncbi:MAG: hypothetical protein KBB94_06585 [Legionellaceae bacterium]|nr:hypothetical protein [Legionellaceae bacterium]MBP9775373.1 hypothetical protein [Legionellaceae bacterium]